MQVHGGMGFIEETGAAQHFRDARITPIYEGTNGIQANDLTFRKTVRDSGAAAQAFAHEIATLADALAGREDAGLSRVGMALSDAVAPLRAAIAWIVETGSLNPAQAASGAYSYLTLWGVVAGGYVTAKSMVEALALPGEPAFTGAKCATAAYYASVLLPQAQPLSNAVRRTHESLLAFPAERF